MKGVPMQAARDAASFSALSTGIEGAAGAYGAEEGERLKGFVTGAGHGALTGAAMGATMGAFGKGFRNLRKGSLNQAANRQLAKPGQMHLLPKAEASRMAKQQMDRGFFKSIGDTFSRKGGPINRATSAQNVAGGLGQFGSEWIAPSLVLPAALGGGLGLGGDESAPPAQAQAQALPQRPAAMQQPRPPVPQPKVAAELETPPSEPLVAPAQKRIIATGLGGASVGIPTSVALSHALERGMLGSGTRGKLLAAGLQTAATMPGLIGGSVVGQKLFPDVETETEQKLDQIDLDKLMRYYKKPEDQV
jgi:hypothetical protein